MFASIVGPPICGNSHLLLDNLRPRRRLHVPRLAEVCTRRYSPDFGMPAGQAINSNCEIQDRRAGCGNLLSHVPYRHPSM